MNKLVALGLAAIFMLFVLMVVALSLDVLAEYQEHVLGWGYVAILVGFFAVAVLKERLDNRVEEYDAPRKTGLYIPAPAIRPEQAAEVPEQQAQPAMTDEEDGDVPT
ncbi:MAG: hypothetical protein R6X02_16810 [Enhygromyxa sp.]